MSRLTVGQKAERVTAFLIGLRKRRVAAALARCGFGKEDLAEGWALLSGLTSGRLDVIYPDGDPKLVDELDAWENDWFPVAYASLRSRFPTVHNFLFNNLVQTEALEVITSVSTSSRVSRRCPLRRARVGSARPAPGAQAPREARHHRRGREGGARHPHAARPARSHRGADGPR